MQPRLCPGQPSGVVVGLLIHPAPGKHPETARPLAPCSEETETRRYLTAALARPMANPTGYKAALAGVPSTCAGDLRELVRVPLRS